MSERQRRAVADESPSTPAREPDETEVATQDNEPAERVYQVHVAEPVEAQAEDARPHIPQGHRLVQYTGPADALRHGERTYRVGEPVIVPSDVAEVLLSLPDEAFQAIEEYPHGS